MPVLKKYDLFLSHAWRYNEDYTGLVKLLNSALYFDWRNYSVPEHDPLIDPMTPVGVGKLTELLDKQVKPVNCVLILGGMYASHSDWILKEIQIANYYSKPIIGVYPWGQLNMPRIIQDNAIDIVGWNTNSIVTSIRQHSI